MQVMPDWIHSAKPRPAKLHKARQQLYRSWRRSSCRRHPARLLSGRLQWFGGFDMLRFEAVPARMGGKHQKTDIELHILPSWEIQLCWSYRVPNLSQRKIQQRVTFGQMQKLSCRMVSTTRNGSQPDLLRMPHWLEPRREQHGRGVLLY